MSSLSGFSKVSVVDVEDEEEERQKQIQSATRKYNTAQDVYSAKGAKQDVLKLFEAAEEAMKPLLASGGLVDLGPRELETVLRGRLHQAVIVAHLEDVPNRWPRVKSLAEDILNYDFGNAHARWLRGLALRSGLGKPAEAEEEMRRAVECARTTGKGTEAHQWEAEIERSFGAGAGEQEEASQEEDGDLDELEEAPGPWEGPVIEEIDDAAPPAKAATAGAGAEPAGAGAGAEPEESRRPQAPALQKGFFNRKSPKAKGEPASASGGAAPAGGDGEAKRSQKAQPQKQADPVAQAALEQERKKLQLRLEDAAQKLKEEQEKREATEAKLQEWQESLSEGLDFVGEEFEEALQSSLGAAAKRDAGAAALGRLRGAAEEVQGKVQEGRTWAEQQHQRYMDFTTEVATLREMCSREQKERAEASKQQSTEMRELARRMGELKSTAKTLRDAVRAQEEEEPDLQRLAERAAEFRRLPTSVKVAALMDDASFLKVALLAAMLGMLLVLGFFIEGFSAYRCRFVCAPR